MMARINAILRYASCVLLLGSAACGDDGSEGDARVDEGGVANADAGGGRGSDAASDGARDGGLGSLDGAVDSARPSGNEAGVSNTDASIDDVDLTLGGFEQDLPAPMIDCVEGQGLALGCLSVSGTYNGTPFGLTCQDQTIMVGKAGSHHIGCRATVAPGDLLIELHLDPILIEPPVKTFSAELPSARTFVEVMNIDREFESYPDDVYNLATTHDQSLRLAGISELVSSGVQHWQIRGTLGFTLTPKASCAKDAQGQGCDEVKLRASFLSRPVKD